MSNYETRVSISTVQIQLEPNLRQILELDLIVKPFSQGFGLDLSLESGPVGNLGIGIFFFLVK